MEATGGTNKVSTTLTLLGLFFDIAGAMLLVWGEIKGTMAFLRYSTTGDGSTLFDSRLKLLKWWRRWALRVGRRFGSQNPYDMEDSVFESFPLTFWGIAFLVLGFALQAIGSLMQ